MLILAMMRNTPGGSPSKAAVGPWPSHDPLVRILSTCVTRMPSLISSMACAAFASFLLLSAGGKAQKTASNGTTVEPCLSIAQAISSNYTQFVPSDALACLQSIPLDVNATVAQIAGLQTLVQFQSDRKPSSSRP